MPDDVMLWPLRAVSKDPTNLTKLDADNNVLTSTTDVDARYVQKAGDTIVGQLIVKPPLGTASTGAFSLIGDDAAATLVVSRSSTSMAGPRVQFNKARGTAAAPAPIVANDNCGSILWNAVRADGASGNAGSITMMAMATPAAGEAAIKSQMVFSVGDGSANAQVMTLDSGGVKIPRLDVAIAAYIDGPIIQRATTGIAQIIRQTSPSDTSQATGLSVAIEPEPCLFSIGMRISNQGFGTSGNRGVEITDLPVGPDNYAILNNSLAASYFRGNVGISAINTTHNLEVNGTTMLRGTCEITGNITSSGTAHSFASGSIPSPAVIGNIPRTIAATGSAGVSGQMVWDDNFLYLRTTAGWKKVALTAI